MHGYSVSVALFDFVPALVAAVGLALLAHGIAYRHRALGAVAWIAVLLIASGGLAKASWKLILALWQEDLAWLNHLLFVLLAPGFAALAFSLHHARSAWQTGGPASEARYPATRLLFWMLAPLGAGAAAAAWNPQSRLWFVLLLAATTLANAALIVNAVITARWRKLPWPVTACFVFNFAATLALAGLARMPAGEFTAWTQEGVNLAAQAALAVGCWRLAQRMADAPRTQEP